MKLFRNILSSIHTTKHSVQVTGLLLSLLALTYWHYYLGLTSINGDVNAHYLSDGYYWWNNGGLVSPPQWVAYAWMGRPGGSNIQDSSFVLPAGITNLLLSWNPTSIAIMSSLMTAFGALGMYLLVKRLTGNHVAALLGLIGQFFAAGIFSNAQFLDFHRGAAYLPWFLMLMSPLWFWEKRWGVPAAALLFWQIFVGVYPGQLVVALYVLGLWFVTWLFSAQAKQWAWRATVSGLLGLSLAIPKYIPALTQGTGNREWEAQRYQLSLESIVTAFFPYGNDALTWDVALRSFFVAIPLLLLAAFGLKARNSLPILSVTLSSLLILLLTRFSENLLTWLPGFDLSRFLVNDIKNYLLIGISLLGILGFARVLDHQVSRRHIILLGLAIALCFGGAYLVTLGIPAGFKNLIFAIVPFLILALSLYALARLTSSSTHREVTTMAVLGVTALSGLFSAYATTQTWASSRLNVEVSHYGYTIQEVISRSQCTTLSQTTRRPEGAIPETEISEWWHDTKALRGAFDCTESLGGYTNVPGNPTLIAQQALFLSEQSEDFIKFFSAPGAVVPVIQEGIPDISQSCLIDGNCSSLTFTPVSYSQRGELTYDIVSQEAQSVALNESFYKGWEAQACDQSGACSVLQVKAGPGENIEAEVPAGSYRLKLEYHQPYRTLMLTWFWVSVLLVTVSFILPGSRKRFVVAGKE